MRRHREWDRFNSGTTLLELLAYCAILMSVLSLGASLFQTSQRLNLLSAEYIARTEAVAGIGDLFQDAVHGACGVMPAAGTFRTTADRLILRCAGEGMYGAVVLGRIGPGGEFGAAWLGSPEEGFPLRKVETVAPVHSIEFATETTGLISLCFVLADRGAMMRKAVTHEYAAAIRYQETP